MCIPGGEQYFFLETTWQSNIQFTGGIAGNWCNLYKGPGKRSGFLIQDVGLADFGRSDFGVAGNSLV